jgi:hypothetical protein
LACMQILEVVSHELHARVRRFVYAIHSFIIDSMRRKLPMTTRRFSASFLS